MKHFFFIVLCVFFSLETLASTASGRLSGNNLVWFSGTEQGDLLVPQMFDYVSRLPNTKRWSGGTFWSSGEGTLVLTSEGGTSVRLPDAKLTGITYAVNGNFSASGDSLPYAGLCGDSTSSGFFSLNNNTGFCLAHGDLTSSSPAVPFERFRPALTLKRGDIINAFKGKPRGTYSGVLSGVVRYAFYVESASGMPPVLTYRNLPVTYAVQIHNEGAHLSKVSVLGNGVITPEYNTYRHTANGTTGFKITALGYFDAGVRFKFANKKADDYTLKTGHKGGTVTPIPYSISCLECVEHELVNEGTNRTPGRWNVVNGTGESIHFNLKVFYQDVAVGDVLDEAPYHDSFTLMLESVL